MEMKGIESKEITNSEMKGTQKEMKRKTKKKEKKMKIIKG